MSDNTTAKNEEAVKNDPFGFGDFNEAYAQYFIGNSYLKGLVSPSDDVDMGVGNMSFEPGCRNNWHAHTTGFQVLMCTQGEGWYQEEGKPARHLKPGDVVIVHRGVKHWHSATKDSWFAHLAITQGATQWYEPVTDEEYAALED